MPTHLLSCSQVERDDKRSQAAKVLGGAGHTFGMMSQTSSVSGQYTLAEERKRLAEDFVARPTARQRLAWEEDRGEAEYWRKKYMEERRRYVSRAPKITNAKADSIAFSAGGGLQAETQAAIEKVGEDDVPKYIGGGEEEYDKS